MSTPKALAASFTITPAICRAEYPAGGGNHILHVSATEARASRDGYIARRNRDGEAWYLTRDDAGKWSAQHMKGGIADNFSWRFDFPSRDTLLASL